LSSSLNVQLTDALRRYVDERASDKDVYATPSEYIRDLIRQDMQDRAIALIDRDQGQNRAWRNYLADAIRDQGPPEEIGHIVPCQEREPRGLGCQDCARVNQGMGLASAVSD
jgi:Arc/MetJ-type ribon-helix-helix transcriptional regulator